jgi:LysR family transcriptional regulator, nod-box dependent transcriptional activator
MDLKGLDLNLLVALDALLSECSITQAAVRLHRSPSATSGALARLREYFGDELLTQIGRRMALTPLGESLREPVRDCLLHVQSTMDIRPKFDPSTVRRNFRLMMSDYVATVLVAPLLQQLGSSAPGVTLELLANVNDPAAVLAQGEVDFLVLPKPFVHREHPSELLFEDEYVCACWTDNRRVGDTITQDECLALGHVVTRIGNVRPPTIDSWFFQHFGHDRRVEVVAMSFGLVPHLLVGTERVAFMHRRLAEFYSRLLPLRWLPSPVPLPRVQEMLQWHRYRQTDPGRAWLYQQIRQTLDQAPVTP